MIGSLVADTNPLDDLRGASGAMSAVVDGVRADQWQLRTPCSEWTVAQVVDHVTVGSLRFASLVDGHHRVAADVTRAMDRPLATRAALRTLIEAFSTRGAIQRPVTLSAGAVPGPTGVGLQVVELLAHGWDVATATGQTLTCPDPITEWAIQTIVPLLPRFPPERALFAPPLRVSKDASTIDRLVALLGRDACWKAP